VTTLVKPAGSGAPNVVAVESDLVVHFAGHLSHRIPGSTPTAHPPSGSGFKNVYTVSV
jgi:hypothetical protein